MLHLSGLYNIHYTHTKKKKDFHTFRNTQIRTGDSGEFGERRLNMDYWALQFNQNVL